MNRLSNHLAARTTGVITTAITTVRATALTAALTTALIGLILQGCQQLQRRSTLFIYLVPPSDAAEVASRKQLNELWAPVMDAYRELEPNVRLELQVIPEAGIFEELQRRNSHGLGPDLVIVNANQAMDLRQRGLLRPIPLSRSLAESIEPAALARVKTAEGLAALPLVWSPQLSCYNRSRIAKPPTTVSDLLSLAADGQRIGISFDPAGLWWSAGALGAEESLATLLSPTKQSLRPAERQALLGWMQWLQQTAMHPQVNIYANDLELTKALQRGQLDWIPCSSLSLQSLANGLGAKLGVAVLPSGPGGGPSPNSRMRVLGFGPNSSARQFQAAKALAELILNPLMQRYMSISDPQALPVNRHARPPVASPALLKTLVAAQRQFQQDAPLQKLSLSLSEQQQIRQVFSRELTPMMVGEISAAAATDNLIKKLGQR
jgi:arabinogalactan oligomer/maltooligosaccharide transport system substrate-binding protein